MYQYCTRCGVKYSDISLHLFSSTPNKITCEQCYLTIYNGPKLAVGAVIISGDNYLMTQRGIEPDKGSYDFPGGFVDYGESTEQAIVRELQEELQLNQGAYDFPGGFVDYGESTEQAIVRELQEELQLNQGAYHIGPILGTVNHLYKNLGKEDEMYSVTTIMFLATTTQTIFTVQDDVAEYKWISIGDIPQNITKMGFLQFIKEHNQFEAFKELK